MIKIVTAAQMREIDRRAIGETGVPGSTLMENAGLAVVKTIRDRIPDLRKVRVNIFACKGNNGGDGFVTARHLLNMGAEPTVFLATHKDEVKGDAKLNLDAFAAMGGRVKEFTSEKHIHNFKLKFMHTTVVVDALFGTGLTSAVTGFFTEILDVMNGQGKLKVAVDIPSGVNADSGVIPGAHFTADVTVTFGLPKIGLVTYPARAAAGELVIADISIPRKVLEESPFAALLPEIADIKRMLPKRAMDGHKGTFGHLLIGAGSTGMGGAAALCSLAALRMGTGLVTAALPSGLVGPFETGVMEVIARPLAQTESGSIASDAADIFIQAAGAMQAVILGPGLSTHPSTAAFAKRAVAEIEAPMVVDADGLNCLGHGADIIKNRTAPTVITPHPGEMARLTGAGVDEIQSDRIGAALALAGQSGAVVVLKGAGTVIATPDGKAYVNPTGNHGLACAGTGDVLAGMIGGLLAQGVNAENAAVAGVYLHGLAADIFAKEHGDPRGLIASDLIKLLPDVFGRL